MKPSPGRKIGLLVLIWVICLGSAAAQGPNSEPPSQRPTLVSVQAPTIEALQAKIKELESTDDLDPAIKNKAMELYDLALNRLESAQSHEAKRAEFAQAIESAPSQTQQILSEVRQAALVEPRGQVEVSPSTKAKDIEPMVTKEQADLASLKSRLTELDQDLKTLKDRPEQARQLLAEARQKLSDVEKELAAPPSDNDPPVLGVARRAALEARRQARLAEVGRLEQELLSHNARTELLQAQRDLAASRVAPTESHLKALQELANRLRRDEAQRAKRDAERIRLEAMGSHQFVKTLADQNVVLSNELSQLLPGIEQAVAKQQQVSENFEQVEQDFTNATEKLEIVGLSDVLGQVLREQRRGLPDVGAYDRNAARRREQIAKAGLRNFEIEQQRQDLADLPGKLDQFLEDYDRQPDPSVDRLDFELEIRKLLERQRELLDTLSDAYARYLKELGDLDFSEKQLVDRAQQYAAFLDERLLWIPSASPIGRATLQDLGPAVTSLTDVSYWTQFAHRMMTLATDDWAATSTVVMAFVALLVFRPRIRTRLKSYDGRVGKIHTDSFWITLAAMGMVFLLAMPWPLLAGGIGWLLGRPVDTPPFTKAVAVGLTHIAMLGLILRFFYLMCEPRCVAELHLRWRNHTTSLIRRGLVWLMAILLPMMMLTSMLEVYGSAPHKQSLGRLAFMTLMGTVAAFTASVLNPRTGMPAYVLAENPDRWLSRLRYGWYLLAVGIPLALIGLAAAGYTYTAIELEQRLLATACLLVAAVMSHELVIRWLFVTYRKLALEKARAQQQAARASQADGPGAPDDDDEAEAHLDATEIDLATIDAQTKHLLRTVVGFTMAVGLWLIWADVVPALGLLREVSLYEVAADGLDRVESVTLADLALAAVVTALTIGAARNLPGVLEIAVLQHLPLDSGSRYAITTICRYVITTVGFVVAFEAVGVGWAQVQWLVAALGVGLGFGLQEIFANFVSGLIILFERPFRVGDTVTVGDITGVVSRIQIRATTVTDWDRKELIVPNKSFITDRLVNWTLSDPITRLRINVGIAYGSDTKLAQRVMVDAAKLVPRVLKQPDPEVFFLGFGDSTLDFEVRVYVAEYTNRARTEVIHELHHRIDQAFRQEGITIAFPQRDVHLYPTGVSQPSDADPTPQTG